MEVLTVGAVSVDDAIELLLDPLGLKDLAGHGAICFAVVDAMTTPGFYGRLIADASSIDATTRGHVVFAVFHGDRSGITYRATICGHPCLARYQVRGFSISADHDVYVVAKPDLRRIRPELDPRLAQALGYPRSDVDHPIPSRIGHACRCLMERYSIPETALPCLLFVDAGDPTKSIIIRLSPQNPLPSLNDVLQSMSKEFADLSRFWKGREEIEGVRRRLEHANTAVRDLPGKIAKCNDRLRRATENATAGATRWSRELDQWQAIEKAIEGSYADPSVCTRIEHHPVAGQVIEQLRSYQNRLAEAKAIEDSFLITSVYEASSPEQFYLERTRQERRLDRLERSIARKAAGIGSFVRDAIRRLDESISRAEFELAVATGEKSSLERRLEEARALLRRHGPDALDEDERSIADLGGTLRSRGYGDDVLANSSAAAFAVVKSLLDGNRLEVIEPAPHSEMGCASASQTSYKWGGRRTRTPCR